MIMTDEQITQNAWNDLGRYTSCDENEWIDGYVVGAHSRDNEVEMLQRQIEELSEQLKMNVENIQRLRRPWVNVLNKLPEEDPDYKGYSVEVIGLFSDGSVSKCFCSIEEDIWFFEGITCDKPTHWMPMPDIY